jgi:hypothetical protein
MDDAQEQDEGDVEPAEQTGVEAAVSQFEELDLTLEEDLTLEDSTVGTGAEQETGVADDSAVDVAGEGLDDDDLVLGGSGSGSDITIGGDSGISLVDPADSGLSLEEPLDLGAGAQESLELGEDDMIALAAEDEATGVKTDEDFLLTPMEEAGDEGDSESGSQVIALDTEEDASATAVGGAPMTAMLDEEAEAEEELDLGAGAVMGEAVLGGEPGEMVGGAPLPEAAGLPETPYSTLNVVGLSLCVVMLAFCGMFMYELLHNMWSWDQTHSVPSTLMDFVVGLFEG